MSGSSRVRRLLQIVALLASGKKLNAPQLAELNGVSRRTIFRDLVALQESGVPLHYDDQLQQYSIRQRQFLPPADLTLEETLAVILLGYELGGKEGVLPLGAQARSAALKLASNLPQKLRDYVNDLTQSILVRLDYHEEWPAGETTTFDLLRQALVDRRAIRIHYQSLTEQAEISTQLSPYRMLFSRRSWYVIGRSSLHRAVRTFKIARIRQAERLDVPYEIPPRFNLDRYLGHAWHLIRETGPTSAVRVRFQKMVAQNVAEVRWHKTQRTEWNDDGTLDFHVQVDGLQEISWWILGYGDQAEVLEPPELRQIIAQRVRGMAAIYADN